MSGKSNPDYSELTDEELILKFQDGEEKAFTEIAFRYKDRIVNFLCRYTGNRQDAEDLAQEAFINLYKSKHRYKVIAKFSTWFFTIGLNLAKSYSRTKFSRGKLRSQMVYLDDTSYDRENYYNVHDSAKSGEDHSNLDMESQYIQRVINTLDQKYKEVLILRDIQDFDYEEISKILNVPVGTVRSRLNRARGQMKVKLEKIYKQK